MLPDITSFKMTDYINNSSDAYSRVPDNCHGRLPNAAQQHQQLQLQHQQQFLQQQQQQQQQQQRRFNVHQQSLHRIGYPVVDPVASAVPQLESISSVKTPFAMNRVAGGNCTSSSSSSSAADSLVPPAPPPLTHLPSARHQLPPPQTFLPSSPHRQNTPAAVATQRQIALKPMPPPTPSPPSSSSSSLARLLSGLSPPHPSSSPSSFSSSTSSRKVTVASSTLLAAPETGFPVPKIESRFDDNDFQSPIDEFLHSLSAARFAEDDVLSDLNCTWPISTSSDVLGASSTFTRPDDNDEKRAIKPKKSTNDNNNNNNTQNGSNNNNYDDDDSNNRTKSRCGSPDSGTYDRLKTTATLTPMEAEGAAAAAAPRNPQQASPAKPVEGLWGDKHLGGGAGGGGEGLKLEYMDLDEFLLENAIALTEGGDSNSNEGSESGSINSRTAEPASHSHPYATRVSSSRRSLGSDGCGGDGSISGGSTESGSTGTQSDDDNDNDRSKRTQGHEFDPEDASFQGPSSRKNRKTFVPDHCKDERYWQRRRKNNMAAKRSRDARRVKENQIAIRANYLEAENERLKEQLKLLRQENLTLRSQVAGKTESDADHITPR